MDQLPEVKTINDLPAELLLRKQIFKRLTTRLVSLTDLLNAKFCNLNWCASSGTG